MKNSLLIASVIFIVLIVSLVFLFGNNKSTIVTSNNSSLGNRILPSTTTNLPIKNSTINNSNTSVKILYSQNNFYALNATSINNTLGNKWNFSQEIETPGSIGSGEQNITLYNYTGSKQQITFFRLEFNSTATSSEFYDSQVSGVRTKLNTTIFNYTLQSESPAVAFNSSNSVATYKKAIIAMTPYKNYFYEIVLFNNKNYTLSNTAPKIVLLLQKVENSNLAVHISNLSTTYLNNTYSGDWKNISTTILKLNATQKKNGENYIKIENFSNNLNYNLSLGIVNLINSSDAVSAFSSEISKMPGVNGAISNNHEAHIFTNESIIIPAKNNVGAASIDGNYLFVINVYSNKRNVTQNLVLPGEINLLERIENAELLVNNQSTSLDNLSRLPPTPTNVSLINTTLLNKNFGGIWRFVEGHNVTSGLPTGGLKYTVENFTNNLENFTISIGNYINSTSVVGVYNGGIQTISSSSGLNISYKAFNDGLSYVQISGVIANQKNQTESLLGEINPYGKYLIQESLYSRNTSKNLSDYRVALNDIQQKIMSGVGSMPIPGNSIYLTANQLSLILGGTWNTSSIKYKNTSVYGSINEGIVNYTTSRGDLIKQSIELFNTGSNASASYENITSRLLNDKTNVTTVASALNNDYTYTITNNTQFTGSSNGVSVIAQYGNKLIQISIYPNSTNQITIRNGGLLLLTFLNYSEN